MKYIKKYEDIKYFGEYWLLPTDERFEDSLKKINCPIIFINRCLRNSDLRSYSYAFIGFWYHQMLYNTEDAYGWVKYNGNIPCSFYVDAGFKFGGLINIEKYELESKKYNL